MTRNEDIFIPLGVRRQSPRPSAPTCLSPSTPTPLPARLHAVQAFTCSTPKARPAPPPNSSPKPKTTPTPSAAFPKSGNRSVDNAILDMTQTATMRDSCKLGHSVLTELGKLNQLHKGRVDEANLRRPARPTSRPSLSKPPSCPTPPKSGCSAATPSDANAPMPSPPASKNTSPTPYCAEGS